VRLEAAPPAPALLVPDASVLPDQSEHIVLTVGPNDVVTPKQVQIGDLRGGLRVIRSGRFGLAYLHVIEPRISGSTPVGENLKPVASETLRKIFTGKIIAAGGFEPDTAEAIIAKGDADLASFGRHFIANPDLPKRIRLGLALNPYDRSTFYGREARGYTDYPFYQESAAVASTFREQERAA